MVTDILHEHRIIDCQHLVSQECHHKHTPHEHRTGKPELRISLPLHMDGECMEMRVQGLGVYAEILLRPA